MAPGVRSALAVACGLALLGAHSAWAEGDVGEAVVVTATRVPVPISQLVSDVTVLNRADINRAVAQDLADLLRQQAGLEVARSGGVGSVSSIFTRGADNRFTALLIDGVRVDAQSGDGGASWLNIPLALIDRIEIVRGPASAVYGSDAVAGVVQVFTRRGSDKTLTELGLGGGTQGAAQADALVSGKLGNVDYALSAAAERAQGSSAIVNPANSSYNPDEDGFRRHSAQARVGWQVNAAHRLELNALQSHTDAQYDAYHSARDDHSVNDLDTTSAVWSAQWLQSWRSQLLVGDATQQYSTHPGLSSTQTQSRTAAIQNHLQFGMHGVHLTAEARHDMLDNTDLTRAQTVGQASRTLNGLALGYDLRQSGHALQLNARTDVDSSFGRHNTGSIAGGWQVLESLRLTASTGTAFRAPTLYQRYSTYGYANLAPESSRNVEVGAAFKAGAVATSLTLYRNRVSHLIDFDPTCTSTPIGCYQNVGHAVLKGATWQSSWDLHVVRLSGSVDVQSPRNEDTGEQLLRRARRHASLQATSTVLGWDAAVQWQGSSSRADFDWDQYAPVVLHGYSTVNLSVGRALSPHWKLMFKLDNAFQRDYQTAYSYGGTQRKALVSLRWTPEL